MRLLRERTLSLVSPGEFLPRQELADLVNAHVLECTERPGALDANYIGKLERGVIMWPRVHCRQALRSMLVAETDRELGLARPDRAGRSVVVVERPARLRTGPVPEPRADPDGLLAAMTRLPIAVSREHVDALRATAVMFTDADHSHGGGDVTSAAGVHLGHAAQLLRLTCPANLRPELLSAVGWLGHIVGWAAFDATRHDEAGEVFAFTLALLGRVQDTMRNLRVADEHFRRTSPSVDPPWMSYDDTAQHLGDTGHALFDRPCTAATSRKPPGG